MRLLIQPTPDFSHPAATDSILAQLRLIRACISEQVIKNPQKRDKSKGPDLSIRASA
jgi:hypothetical protein